MEVSQSIINHNQTASETQSQLSNPNNSRLFVAVIISVLLTAVITGSSVYFLQKSANEKIISTLEQKIASIEMQVSEKKPLIEEGSGVIQASPTPTLPPTDEMMTYKDPMGRYTFRYPSNWKILDKVPEKFRAAPSYLEGGNLEEWLNGKMMEESCIGPILQNISDPNQLIVFEIVDAKSDGIFCWTSGYFMDDNKWKVAESYIYPVGSSNVYEPEWKGDYIKIERVKESKKFIAFAALVNYETFQLKGEDAFQSIISSFQFTN